MLERKQFGHSERGDRDLRVSSESEIRAEEIAVREAHFLALGFSKRCIEKIKNFSPTLYRIEIVDEKIEVLKERGFNNPHKMIESLPSILGLDFKNIDDKITGLKERGFNNPHKMIESAPSILGFSFENIDAKLSGLKERGFNNPHKMIESAPSILGYSFENIDQKLKMLDKLRKIYELPWSGAALVEKNLPILTSKIDKLWVLARICRQYLDNSEQLTPQLVNKLLFSNLENLLIALQTDSTINTVDALLKQTNVIKKKENLSKEEKRQRIMSGSRDEIKKIYERYLRGYPLSDAEKEYT